MFNPRTIEEAQQDYLLALARVDSPINLDISKGSVVYSLSRGAAALAAQQDLMLKEAASNSLLEATGELLDNYGASFGINRLGDSYAQGFVLATVESDGNAVTIANGLQLIDLATGLQFFVKATGLVFAYAVVETRLQVVAAQTGASSNLAAGSRLSAPTLPNVSFVVGSVHETAYKGDLTGGRDLETDFAYRQRISTFLISRGSSSETELTLKLLEYPTVTRVYAKTIVGGFVELWIDSLYQLTDSQLKEVKNYIAPYLYAGTIPILAQVRKVPLNFHVVVEPYKNASTDLNMLTQKINDIISLLLNALDIGESLSKDRLLNALRPFARSVTITGLPAVQSPGVGSVFTKGDIRVIYPTEY